MLDTFAKTLLGVACMVCATCGGCAQSWQMDYGAPAAQFLAMDVAAKGERFVGQKITVQGTVTRIDTSDAAAAWVHLEHGVRCNFGKLKAMATASQPGETVWVDGFLVRCEEGDVLLEPAMLRDPAAPFSPQ